MKAAIFPIVAAAAFLTACGRGEVNPPTEPAQPLRTPEAMQPVQPKGPSSLATRGPRSFVGVWAENLNWCSQQDGPQSPVRITPLRFEAHQNNCDIASIQETGSGYAATLSCVANGQAMTERLHLSSSGDVLSLVYLDQDWPSVKLARCPDSPRAAEAANPLAKILKKEDAQDEPAKGADAPQPAAPPPTSGQG